MTVTTEMGSLNSKLKSKTSTNNINHYFKISMFISSLSRMLANTSICYLTITIEVGLCWVLNLEYLMKIHTSSIPQLSWLRWNLMVWFVPGCTCIDSAYTGQCGRYHSGKTASPSQYPPQPGFSWHCRSWGSHLCRHAVCRTIQVQYTGHLVKLFLVYHKLCYCFKIEIFNSRIDVQQKWSIWLHYLMSVHINVLNGRKFRNWHSFCICLLGKEFVRSGV